MSFVLTCNNQNYRVEKKIIFELKTKKKKKDKKYEKNVARIIVMDIRQL